MRDFARLRETLRAALCVASLSACSGHHHRPLPTCPSGDWCGDGATSAAFATKDGSVYVRKDFKVLKVDVSKLPASVGKTPISRADAAVSVAQLIMGCWTGT